MCPTLLIEHGTLLFKIIIYKFCIKIFVLMKYWPVSIPKLLENLPQGLNGISDIGV